MELEDRQRWSDDFSSVAQSPWLWLFTKAPETRAEFDPIMTPASHFGLHFYNHATEEHHIITANIQICREMALLDLEYWENVASSNRNSNRIARYLGKLRDAVRMELQNDSILTKQPDCLTPWAVRTKLNIGHSNFGRNAYKARCDKEKWEPYSHDDPLEYGNDYTPNICMDSPHC